jgi:hypothetical protein
MIILLWYGLLFLHDKQCLRFFQIGFIIIIGVQCIFSSQYMIRFPDMARVLVFTGWIYGNQSNYAIYAMCLPVLIWRSLSEKRLLKVILIICSAFILLTTLISGFATPIGLIVIGIASSLIFSIIYPIKILKARRSGIRQLVLNIILIGGALVLYQNTKTLTYFTGSYSRITTFISNPQSGGYSPDLAAQGSRWMLAKKSYALFLTNPFFGDGGSPRYNPNNGGHSSFIDTLAVFGILGGGGAIFGVVIFIVFRAYKRYRMYRNWETLAGLISSLLLLVAGIADPYWEFDAIPFIILISGILLINNSRSVKISDKSKNDIGQTLNLAKSLK